MRHKISVDQLICDSEIERTTQKNNRIKKRLSKEAH